jgi:hypothetical protein
VPSSSPAGRVSPTIAKTSREMDPPEAPTLPLMGPVFVVHPVDPLLEPPLLDALPLLLPAPLLPPPLLEAPPPLLLPELPPPEPPEPELAPPSPWSGKLPPLDAPHAPRLTQITATTGAMKAARGIRMRRSVSPRTFPVKRGQAPVCRSHRRTELLQEHCVFPGPETCQVFRLKRQVSSRET